MRKRNLPKKRHSKVRRQHDPIPWKYCLLTVVCGLILVTGFFWAARSHFSSMDYGMKNAKLRKEIEELKSETRRLKLAREIALSPNEIKKAAKKLGLTTMTARNIQVIGKKEELEDSSEKSNKKIDLPTEKTSLVTEKTKKSKSKNKEKKELKKDKKTEKRKIIIDKEVEEYTAENFRKNGTSQTQSTKR